MRTDRHARASRTYGVTTLTKRHVEIEGDEIRFCFRSKNRKLTRRSIRNAVLARELGELVAPVAQPAISAGAAAAASHA